MKSIVTIISMLFMAGCVGRVEHKTVCSDPQDSISTIEFMCKETEEEKLSQEQIEWFDEMNEEGGYMLVRGAERNLDTIVNHLHMVFITEK